MTTYLTHAAKKNKIVVKETLLCNGREKCGGMGACIKGCQDGEKRAKHGHRCSFKVTLQMKLHTIGTWSVEFSGRHVPVTSVGEPPKKNPLRNTETKARCLQAIQEGNRTVRVVAVAISDDITPAKRPSRRQLEFFVKKHCVDNAPEVQPRPQLVGYPDSDKSEEEDINDNFFRLVKFKETGNQFVTNTGTGFQAGPYFPN